MFLCLGEKVSLKNFCKFYSADLNVEHLQLLLFMFHNFSHLQRQAVLHDCIQAIISVSKEPSLTKTVPVALARLLLLLDYFIHHFSAPPQELFKQVLLLFTGV